MRNEWVLRREVVRHGDRARVTLEPFEQVGFGDGQINHFGVEASARLDQGGRIESASGAKTIENVIVLLARRRKRYRVERHGLREKSGDDPASIRRVENGEMRVALCLTA